MIGITVTVDDAHLPSIRALAAGLTDRGMYVDSVLPTVGVITGACPAERLPGIAEVPGVVAVERTRGLTATGPDDEGATTTSQPVGPPPAATDADRAEGLSLEREPDGRYRVVDPADPIDTPPPPDDEGRP